MTDWTEGDVQAQDVSIHYYRTGSRERPPLLLLHGITDNGLCWSRVAHDLAARYDVVMTDARGHGQSGLGSGFSTDALADDAAAVIQSLALGPAFLWGHSMGAMTAAAVAARYPELVRAAVLEDPPFFATPPEPAGREAMRQWAQELKQQSVDDLMTRGRAENPGWAEEEIVPWAQSKKQVADDVFEARGRLGAYPWRQVLSQIACPVLLVTGDPERGAIVTPAVAAEARQLSDKVRVAHISGAGHSIHRDRYQETLAAVEDFLAQE